jgi:Pretoxin HINT domain
MEQFSGFISRPALRGDGASVATLRTRDRVEAPKTKIRVGVDYTFTDAFGTGCVTYLFERNQLFCLTDGRVVDAEHLTDGMKFHLEGEMVATVTKVEPPKVVSPPPQGGDSTGNSFKSVVGTINYTGIYPIIDLVVGDLQLKTTPGHRFYSLSQLDWVDAASLTAGEHLQNEQGEVVSITSTSAPRSEPIKLYNIEVEDYHTYFVGRAGGTAVWSHNGLENGGCGIPKPARISQQGKEELASRVARAINAGEALPQEYLALSLRTRSRVLQIARKDVKPELRHGNATDSAEPVVGYRLVSNADNSVQHYGITKDFLVVGSQVRQTRYTQEFLTRERLRFEPMTNQMPRDQGLGWESWIIRSYFQLNGEMPPKNPRFR